MNPISISAPGFDDNPENVLTFLEEFRTTAAMRRNVSTNIGNLLQSVDPENWPGSIRRTERFYARLVNETNRFYNRNIFIGFNGMINRNWADVGGRPRTRTRLLNQLQTISTLTGKSEISILGSFVLGYREGGSRLYIKDRSLHRIEGRKHKGGREDPADGPIKLRPGFIGILDTFRQGGLDNFYQQQGVIRTNGLLPATLRLNEGLHNGQRNPEAAGDIQSVCVPYTEAFLVYASYTGYSYWRFRNQLVVAAGFSSTDVTNLSRLAMNIWLALTFAAFGGPPWSHPTPGSLPTPYSERARPLSQRELAQVISDEVERRLGLTRQEIIQRGRTDPNWIRTTVRPLIVEVSREKERENRTGLIYGAKTVLDYVQDNNLTLDDILKFIRFRDSGGLRRDFISNRTRMTSALKTGIIITALEEEQIRWASTRLTISP